MLWLLASLVWQAENQAGDTSCEVWMIKKARVIVRNRNGIKTRVEQIRPQSEQNAGFGDVEFQPGYMLATSSCPGSEIVSKMFLGYWHVSERPFVWAWACIVFCPLCL